MRVTDDRYCRDRLRFDLALRLIGHEARTHTIRAWTGLTEDRQLRSNVEWRLSRPLSVQTSYDNVSTVSSGSVGNFGLDFRWRLEFD